jgi:hypothetical protein
VVLQTEVLVQPVECNLAGRVTVAETPLVSEPVSLDDENMLCLPPNCRPKRDQHWTRTKDDVQDAHKHQLPYLRGFADLFINPPTGHHFLAQTPILLSDAQCHCSIPHDLLAAEITAQRTFWSVVLTAVDLDTMYRSGCGNKIPLRPDLRNSWSSSRGGVNVNPEVGGYIGATFGESDLVDDIKSKYPWRLFADSLVLRKRKLPIVLRLAERLDQRKPVCRKSS